MSAEQHYAFSHSLWRQAAELAVVDEERARLHGAAFYAISALPGESRARDLALATHAALAGTHVSAERAVSALVAAAKAAEEIASFSEAIELHERVLARDGGAESAKLEAARSAGRLCYATGKAAKARRHYEFALVASRAAGELGKASETLNSLGVLLHELGEIDAAQAALEEAIELARKARHAQAEILASGNLASIFRDVGRMAEAKLMCARNIQLCREHKMRTAEAMGVFNMAAFLHMSGDLGAARGYYDEALKLMREVGNLRNEAIALSNMSTFQRSLGDLTAAEELCRRALDVCRRAGHQRFEAINNSNLAGMLHERGLNTEALWHHREAIRIQREIGDTRHEGLSLGNLAGFFHDLGELGRAQAAYADGLTLLDQSGTQDLGGAIRGLRGQFRLMLGDRIGAADDLQTALWNLEGVGAAALRAECVLMLQLRLAADRFIETGDASELEAARATLAEMNAIAQKGGYGDSSGLGRAVKFGAELLAEVAAAKSENRAARVYCGHLPHEISASAQAALCARAASRSNSANVTLLKSGTSTPDWTGSDYEA
jgi:tetratricopeptide (TPR) repeat protein